MQTSHVNLAVTEKFFGDAQYPCIRSTLHGERSLTIHFTDKTLYKFRFLREGLDDPLQSAVFNAQNCSDEHYFFFNNMRERLNFSFTRQPVDLIDLWQFSDLEMITIGSFDGSFEFKFLPRRLIGIEEKTPQGRTIYEVNGRDASVQRYLPPMHMLDFVKLKPGETDEEFCYTIPRDGEIVPLGRDIN